MIDKILSRNIGQRPVGIGHVAPGQFLKDVHKLFLLSKISLTRSHSRFEQLYFYKLIFLLQWPKTCELGVNPHIF